MKRFICIAFLLAAFFTVTGFDSTQDKQRVFDACELLMSSEVEDAEEILKKQSIQDKIDYVFISTDDLEGYNVKEYMSAFAKSRQLGFGKVGGDCIILLVDLQNKQATIGPQGEIKDKFENADISSLMDDILPYIQKNEYLSAIEVFVHDVHSKIEAKNTKSSSISSEEKQRAVSDDFTEDFAEDDTMSDTKNRAKDEKEEYEKQDEGGLFSNPLTCLLIGAVLSGIVVFTMILSGKSSMQAGADTYTKEARVNPYTKQDIFIRTVTQKTKKEKPKEK